MGVANPLVAELDCVAIFGMLVNFTNSIHREMFNERKNVVGNWRVELTGRLFDADGSALVIHAGVDDYSTDPTGNAGDRTACGLIVAGN